VPAEEPQQCQEPLALRAQEFPGAADAQAIRADQQVRYLVDGITVAGLLDKRKREHDLAAVDDEARQQQSDARPALPTAPLLPEVPAQGQRIDQREYPQDEGGMSPMSETKKALSSAVKALPAMARRSAVDSRPKTRSGATEIATKSSPISAALAPVLAAK
jgi:hypothetical protein